MIGLDKSGHQESIIFFFHKKVVGYQKRLCEALLMRTHNIYFHGGEKNINNFQLKNMLYLEI